MGRQKKPKKKNNKKFGRDIYKAKRNELKLLKPGMFFVHAVDNWLLG